MGIFAMNKDVAFRVREGSKFSAACLAQMQALTSVDMLLTFTITEFVGENDNTPQHASGNVPKYSLRLPDPLCTTSLINSLVTEVRFL